MMPRQRSERLVLLSLLAVISITVAVVWIGGRGREARAPSTVPQAEPSLEKTSGPGADLAGGEAAEPAPPGAGEFHHIEGQVLHAWTREPIAGAVVVLWQGRVSWFRQYSEEIARQYSEEIARAETGASGRFAIEVPPTAETGWFELTISKSGFLPHKNETPRLSDAGAEAATGLELTLLVPGLPVEGQVLLPDGSPASSGWIHTLDRCVGGGDDLEYKELAPISIGKDGCFSAAATGTRVAFQASVPGYAPAFSEFVYPSSLATTQVTIQVREGRTVQVTVVDTSGEPVSSAAVQYRPLRTVVEGPDAFFRRYRLEEGWQGETDASGRCILSGIPGVPGLCSARHPELQPSLQRSLDPSSEEIVIVMAPGRWIVARLPMDAASEVRILGLMPMVLLLTRQGEIHRSPALPPTPGAGMLYVPGYFPQRVRWPGGTGEHDLGELALDPGLTLCVKVHDAARNPLPGVTVSRSGGDSVLPFVIQDLSRKTDHKGEVCFTGLLRGPCDLTATADGYLSRTVTHRLEPDGEALEMTLDRAAAVALRVFGHDGLPAEDGSIRWASGAGYFLLAPVPDAGPDGSIRWAPVPPGVPLKLMIAAPGTLLREISLPPLEPGETRDLGEIHLERGAVVQAQVRDQFGEPLPGAAVNVDWTKKTTTDGRGACEVTGLEAAWKYRLHVSHPDCVEEWTLSVVLDHNEVRMVTIELERGEEYEARVLYRNGNPVVGAEVHLQDSGSRKYDGGRTDASGRFRIRGIRPRPVEVSVSHGQLSTTIAADDVARLPPRILLPHGASLEIEARTEEGLAVASHLSILGRLPADDDPWRDLGGLVEDESPGRALITHLLPRAIEVTVRADGFHPTEARRVVLEAGRTSVFQVVLRPLPPPLLIEILVQTAEGRPLYGAAVASRVSFVLTGLDGIAEILCSAEEAEGDEEGLHVGKTGYVIQRLENVPSAARNGRVVVTLEREAELAVAIREADGSPAKEEKHLRLRMFGPSEPEEWEVPGDPTDGVYRFEFLSGGSYVIKVLDRRRVIAEMPATLLPGEEREITITLPPTPDVTGRVMVDGAPAAGGRVIFALPEGGSDRACEVGAEGYFGVTLRAPGLHEIAYAGPGDEGRFSLPPRVIEPGEVLELNITTSSLEGIVRDVDGNPLAGRLIHLWGRRQFKLRTDTEGRFAIAGVLPGEYHWALVFIPPGLFYHGVIQVGAADEVELIVLPGADVTLMWPEELRGEVGSVFLLQAEGRELLLCYVRDRSPARVRLPLGEQWIKASAGDWWLARQRVRVSGGGQRIPLRFQQAGRIRIVCDIERIPELWNAQLRVDRIDGAGEIPDRSVLTVSSTGTKEFPALPGSYRVRAILPDGRALEKSGTVEAKKVLEIRLP